MELVQELFVTAFVALVFSFFVAKLVSIAASGDAKRDQRLEKSGVVVETKFDGGLRVQSTKSRREVRLAEESIQKVDEVQGFEEKRCDSAVIFDAAGRSEVVEVVGRSLESTDGRLTAAEILGGTEVVGITEADVLTNLDGLVVEEGSDGEKAEGIEIVMNEGNATADLVVVEEIVDEFKCERAIDKAVEPCCSDEFKLCDLSLIYDSADRIKVLEVGGLAVDLLEEQLTREAVDVAEIVDGTAVDVIKEEDAVTNLDGLVFEESCKGKEADDVEGGTIKEEDEMTSLDGLVDEERNEEKEADDIQSVTKKHDAGTNFDGLGKEVDDIESAINEGNEMTDLVPKEKFLENAEVDRNIDDGSVSGRDDIVAAQELGSWSEGGLNKGDIKEEELVGDEEDDWEGIERSELDEVFTAAAKFIAGGGKDDRLANVGSDVQMQFYGLHKVAMEGPCHEPQPMAFKISSRAKWNAWQRMGNMNPDVAMEQYVALLSDKVPGWMEGKSLGDDTADSVESGIHAAPYPDMSTDPYDAHNSTKKRELENYGADGGV